jgi:predicted phage terminase large subunit-like protein
MSTVTLTDAQLAGAERLLDLVGPLRLPCCPLVPTPRQESFLRLQEREVLYGGGAGGGKSVALLMAASMYTDVPGYDALLLRPSLPEFDMPGGLIELSHDWFGRSKAHWNGESRMWRFPSGATLWFSFLDGPADVSRYAGTAFSFVGYDELVRFDAVAYLRMLRVLRQPHPDAAMRSAPDGTTLAQVQVRVRATSNPGGRGHVWVKERFVDPATRADHALYLASRLQDNPHLDHDEYLATLAGLPLAERERLVNGDWEIADDGELFRREWFDLIEPHQLPEHTRAVRFWDLAATEPGPGNPDPDYTVGVRLDLHERSGIYYITDIVRVRQGAGAIEQLVADTARLDGKTVTIVIEEEPGAAGKMLTSRYKEHVLRGYAVRSERATGTKEIRAQPVAAAAQNGLVKLVRGRNSREFLDELCSFPHGRHDDCIDALAGAHNNLNPRPRQGMRTYVPRGRIPTHEDRFLDLGF